MPTSQDMAIFVLTMMTIQPIILPLEHADRAKLWDLSLVAIYFSTVTG